MRATKQADPLYVIFEQHLYNFQDSEADRKTFIGQVIDDYLTHLRKLKIVIPQSLEVPVIEELAAQVNVMLVKKIYGFHSIQEFQKKIPTALKKKTRTQYTKLARKAG